MTREPPVLLRFHPEISVDFLFRASASTPTGCKRRTQADVNLQRVVSPFHCLNRKSLGRSNFTSMPLGDRNVQIYIFISSLFCLNVTKQILENNVFFVQGLHGNNHRKTKILVEEKPLPALHLQLSL